MVKNTPDYELRPRWSWNGDDRLDIHKGDIVDFAKELEVHPLVVARAFSFIDVEAIRSAVNRYLECLDVEFSAISGEGDG